MKYESCNVLKPSLRLCYNDVILNFQFNGNKTPCTETHATGVGPYRAMAQYTHASGVGPY